MHPHTTLSKVCRKCHQSFPRDGEHFVYANGTGGRLSYLCRQCHEKTWERLDKLAPLAVSPPTVSTVLPMVALPLDYRTCRHCRERFASASQRWARGNCDACAGEYRKAHPVKVTAESRERVRQSVARLTARYKAPVLRHYSGADPCCACCGEREPLFLAVDHINGGGTQERKRLGVSGGYQFYRWLVENDFPTGYQILCQNCNGAKGSGFLCPHEVARRGLTGRVRVGAVEASA